jgi:hemerythrin superfamily protein
VDAITLLKDDHKTVEKLFKELEKAGDRAVKTKRKLVDQVIEELTTHAYIEETVFYPAAGRWPPPRPCSSAVRPATWASPAT